MIHLEIAASGLARSRFAMSALTETTNAIEVLAHPARAPYARRWVCDVTRRIRWADYDILLALAEHAAHYVPDFIAPIPATPEPSIEDELAAVAATPQARVRQELSRAFTLAEARGASKLPELPVAIAQVLDKQGECGLAQLIAAQLAQFWHREMAAIWPSVYSVLEDDVLQHAVAAAREGFATVFERLHPGLWRDGRSIQVASQHQTRFDARSGVVLMPSAFLPRPALWVAPGGQTMVGYPARGRGRVWTSQEQIDTGSAGLMPRRWVALLSDLDIARTTTELAQRHELSASTVSYHVARLHSSGLLIRHRDGRRVLYRRTERATDMLSVLG